MKNSTEKTNLSTKEKRRNVLKYGVLFLYLLLTVVLCVESLMPGDVSGQHSDAIGNLVDVPVDVVIAPETLELTSTDGALVSDVEVGKSLTLVPVFTPSDATYKQIEWSLSNDLATISGNVITFIKQGTVMVTATSIYNRSLSASFVFSINTVPVSSISVSPISSLEVGETQTLTVSVLPTNATNKGYEVTSNSDCVSISGRTITALKTGVATVTITSTDDRSIFCSTTVTVTERIESVNFVCDGENVSSVDLQPKQTETFYVSGSGLSWSASGDIIVRFSSLNEFTVCPTKNGVATVTVCNKNGSTQTLTINVSGDEPQTEQISAITANDMIVQKKRGRSLDFAVVTSEGKTPNVNFEYSTSDNNVIFVNELGLVEGLNTGTAVVRVRDLVSGLFADVTVTVTELYASELSIKMPPTLYVGKHYPLSYSFTPKDTTAVKTFWQVSDQSIAQITDKGELCFLKAGSVTVTATIEGGAFAKIDVSALNVLDVSDVTLLDFEDFGGFTANYGEATLKRNGCGQINVTFGQNATYKDFLITSSDQKTIAVNGNSVTALKKGAATVTITCHDGDERNAPIVYTVKVTVETQRLSDTISNWMYKIRKAIGHFGAFFVLGILTCFTYFTFIKTKWLAGCVTLTSGFATAALTEFFQSLVPNRGPSLSDVLLDFSGFCLAIAIIGTIALIVHIITRLKSKHTFLQ